VAIRVGLIGLGAIGGRVAQGFAQQSDVKVVAVCDLNGDLAAKTAAALGATWSTDYREMLSGDQVDLVYVGVPPRYHHQIALDVMRAGKHIFCEKPLALHLDDAREMAAVARETRVMGAINISLHQLDGVQLFQRLVRSGYMGALRKVQVEMIFPRWPRDWQQNPWIGGREQGGAIREVSPHLFLVLLEAFGPIRRVLAHMDYPADGRSAEQSATGILELVSGVNISVNLLCNVPRKEQVAITAYGTAGTLGLVDWAVPVGAKANGPLERLAVPEGQGPRMYENLICAVRGENTDGLVSFERGAELQAILDAWERSHAAGAWANVR
jgi:predicted dehydrogenase